MEEMAGPSIVPLTVCKKVYGDNHLIDLNMTGKFTLTFYSTHLKDHLQNAYKLYITHPK
jgi:hypothetical protein